MGTRAPDTLWGFCARPLAAALICSGAALLSAILLLFIFEPRMSFIGWSQALGLLALFLTAGNLGQKLFGLFVYCLLILIQWVYLIAIYFGLH